MRIPIRYQFMLPLLVVAIVSLAVIAGINARTASLRTKTRVEQQLRGVAAVLTGSNFPLTNAVLSQMGELANAEFVLTDDSSDNLASSGIVVAIEDLPAGTRPAKNAREITLGDAIYLGEKSYFYSSLLLKQRPPLLEPRTLHILFPQDEFNTAWRATFLPPLLVGGTTILAVALVTHLVASRICHVLCQLSEDITHLAEGGFSEVRIPMADDETRDLANAVNQTAVRLEEYESEVRSTERMQTLAMIGAGLAHEIRNAATGCRMAIDLHVEDLPQGTPEDDCLEVAKRQLTLIESRLRQFMKLGEGTPLATDQEADMGSLVTEILSLVRPSAQHAEVRLDWQPKDDIRVHAEPKELSQAIMNLILNGLDAAAKSRASHGNPAYMRVELNCSGDQVELVIADSGDGPSEKITDSLFEPFVTDKAEGVGLGLAVTRRVIESYGGSVGWHRSAEETRFIVRLPNAANGANHV